jgi:hypothetical protein
MLVVLKYCDKKIKKLIKMIRTLSPVFAILDLFVWFGKWFGNHGHISSKDNWIFGLLFVSFIGTFLVLEYQKAVREDKEREEKKS